MECIPTILAAALLRCAVSPASSRQGIATGRGSAGWKPATQQIGNLRYALWAASPCEICRLASTENRSGHRSSSFSSSMLLSFSRTRRTTRTRTTRRSGISVHRSYAAFLFLAWKQRVNRESGTRPASLPLTALRVVVEMEGMNRRLLSFLSLWLGLHITALAQSPPASPVKQTVHITMRGWGQAGSRRFSSDQSTALPGGALALSLQ